MSVQTYVEALSLPSNPPTMALLLPAYNCQSALERTLYTLPTDIPLLILIVDDGSNPAITSPPNINNHLIRIVRKLQNTGIEESLKLGVELLAKENIKYIARIDAGDIAINQRFRKQYQFLVDHPNVALVGSYAEMFEESTGKTSYILTLPSEDGEIKNKLFYRTCSLHPTWMFRTEAVVAAGNYRKQYPAAEDLDLFLRICRTHAVANIPEVLLRCELNDKGISSRKRRVQLLSTLKLQWRYKNFLNIFYLAGLFKHIAHFAIPYSLLQKIKRGLFRNSGA